MSGVTRTGDRHIEHHRHNEQGQIAENRLVHRIAACAQRIRLLWLTGNGSGSAGIVRNQGREQKHRRQSRQVDPKGSLPVDLQQTALIRKENGHPADAFKGALQPDHRRSLGPLIK